MTDPDGVPVEELAEDAVLDEVDPEASEGVDPEDEIS